MNVAFVYPNSRQDVLDDIAVGNVPDSLLLGQNHFVDLGIDAAVHDPLLTRKHDGWLWWQLRELALPLELRRVDAIVTPLTGALPIASRVLRGPAVVMLSFGMNVQLRHTGARRRAALLALRAAHRTVCLAEAQRRDLLELSGLDERRVAAVTLGIDATFWRPQDGEPEQLVLSVGKDLARDYGTFAAAVDGLPVGAHACAMPRNLAGVRLPANLTVGLFPTFAELRETYAKAAVVAITQYPETHPEGTEAGGLTALLEAMAMARPIVATDRPVIREYVSDGETALLVPAGDPAALRAAIERLLGDPALAARLGAAARVRVEEHLTTPQLAARLAPVVRAAVEG